MTAAWPLSKLARAGRVLLAMIAFAGFWSGAVLLAWTVLPAVALFSRQRRRSCQRVVAWTFRHVFHRYMRMARLFDARFEGELAVGGPCVLVANHSTLVDVTVIFAEIPDIVCIAKHAYIASPLVGRLLALSGFIGAGSKVADRAALVDAAVRKLEEGCHVLVFPEGSRSPEGGLERFQRGAFEIACRARVPVVPLFLACRPGALRKDQRFWQQPDELALLTIEVGEPIDPARFGFASRRMRAAVEQLYRERLGLVDTTTGGNSAKLAEKG